MLYLKKRKILNKINKKLINYLQDLKDKELELLLISFQLYINLVYS